MGYFSHQGVHVCQFTNSLTDKHAAMFQIDKIMEIIRSGVWTQTDLIDCKSVGEFSR